MSKTPVEFKELFTLINAKLSSTDLEDQKTIASVEFKEMVESLLHEFQTQAPVYNPVIDPDDPMRLIVKDYPMAGAFRGCEFDENSARGAWQSLGIAAATPGPRQVQWEAQLDEIVQSGSKVVLDLVSRAYGNALTEDQLKSLSMKGLGRPAINLPMTKVDRSNYEGYPPVKLAVSGGATEAVELSLPEILKAIQSSPEVTNSIIEIAEAMQEKLMATLKTGMSAAIREMTGTQNIYTLPRTVSPLADHLGYPILDKDAPLILDDIADGVPKDVDDLAKPSRTHEEDGPTR
jgi:hypothetical protein